MPRTAIPIQEVPNQGSIDNIVWTAADAANQHEFDNNGHVQLLAKCTDASVKTVTVVSIADEHGRTGDKAIAVPATTGFAIAGPFKPSIWNQGGTGKTNVNVSAATGLSLAAVRIVP